MTKRNYLILLVLALLFAAPGLTAYLYYRNPQWLIVNTTNKGTLLNPPVLLSPMEDGKKKWRFVLWYPKNCDVDCLQKTDQLARIRLALGRHLYEVDQWLLLNEDCQPMQTAAAQALREQDIHVSRLSKKSLEHLPILTDTPKVFIANPQGYLVLTYVENAKPGDIYHDIKRLLSTEKSG
ncbi:MULTISPECIES: hypothetical protein [Legionella]|uniref:Thioredoxin domain-containing protein n=1 Tax=Legionella maceachernii TaxID=466 RepID=A0A0W0WHS2_9GAMM|nr:hypothetical protein [Legionella maceachernii]KTD31879.1 hypothetical protein Lmac_0069 [Legionella maceachernii]SJZ44320.1 hypothetical protein SAMN02745128_00020 [Legionella maceachernii]SUP04167.1 Uncharacterised protein [Legionella maceachernii]